MNLFERNSFQREIEFFSPLDLPLAAYSLITPMDCSKIIFKARKYRPSSIASYYKKLNREQQDFVNKRTQQEFEKSTKIAYKLNRNFKKDIPYIQHWWRIWECVLRNFIIYSFAPSTYQLSTQEQSDIDYCASQVEASTAILQGITGKAFSSFRNILEMKIEEIQAKPSFFEQATKYLVLGACFFLINSFPAIGVVTTLVGKKGSEIFHDTLKDISSKYVEDIVDKAYADQENNPVLKTEKKISLSEYLTWTDIDNFVFSQKQQREAYNTTKLNLVTKITSEFAQEGKKKAIINEFKENIIKKKEVLNEKREKFFFIETIRLLSDFINSAAHKRTSSPSGGGFLWGGPPKFDKDSFVLYVPGGYEEYTGLISITFEMSDMLAPNSGIITKNANFSRATVRVHCSPSQNIERGLKKIMNNFGVEELWGNPFDMPVRKFLHLVYKDEFKINIYLDYFISRQGPTAGLPVYGLRYYYTEPYKVALNNKHFNSYPTGGDTSNKVAYNLNMESKFGKAFCDTILLGFFNEKFRTQFPELRGMRQMRSNILVSSTDSLDKVKAATRKAIFAS